MVECLGWATGFSLIRRTLIAYCNLTSVNQKTYSEESYSYSYTFPASRLASRSALDCTLPGSLLLRLRGCAHSSSGIRQSFRRDHTEATQSHVTQLDPEKFYSNHLTQISHNCWRERERERERERLPVQLANCKLFVERCLRQYYEDQVNTGHVLSYQLYVPVKTTPVTEREGEGRERDRERLLDR